MATQDDVDLQYLWILPKYLELTPEAKYRASGNLHCSSDSDFDLVRLNALSDTTKIYRCGCVYVKSEDLNTEESERLRFCKENSIRSSCMPIAQFKFYKHGHRTLREHGVDIRGGLAALLRLDQQAYKEKTGFPTSALIIMDPEKASKVINLGVKLDSPVPTHPKSLEEAATMYGRIVALVGDDKTIKEVEKDISETKNEHKLWALKREKFRL
ncbi:hypothetical protein K491DRAFT_77363 [Lophiostoma macrostomum CBS 122681]|uniref:Uncharacterized protein n=1 Tax=Lophiostoma macrostomum CBS 122681 TaxID=1314788 RepID=A0A6A6TJR8_9PLEO|nr:hypothetical protein K491DRAFT_77363 [Lophiostoma macrostomum CBS 122681]